jgi:4-diphosphocytidyl-2-C-methyl-D-erythritol kinase
VERVGVKLLVESPAKLNLIHAVGELRSDGFHEVSGIVQLIDLCDDVSVEVDSIEAESPSVEVFAPGVPGGDTLATKAAYLFARAYTREVHLLEEEPTTLSINIKIDKRIPIGAGLGGGSSNAATVLSSLERLTGEQLGWDRIVELAAEIGSDVPFFLSATGAAYISGRGENFKPIVPPPNRHWLIAWPGVDLPTASVYAKAVPSTRELPNQKTCEQAVRQGNFRNDLTGAAMLLCPEVGQLVDALEARGARPALVCGSGSAVAIPVDGEHGRAILEDPQVQALTRKGLCTIVEAWRPVGS